LFLREARAAVPPRDTPPLPFRAGEPTEKSLYHFLKNLGGGNFKRICKGIFFWRGACGLARTGGEAWLAFSLKMGSSLVVKFHQYLKKEPYRALF